MKYQLKRIDTWSAVKIAFLIAGVVGFVVGALYAVILTVMAGFMDMAGLSGDMPDPGGFFVGAAGFIAVVVWIVLTILYAVLGALVVALATWLYNLLAGALGGVTMTLETEPVAAPAAASASSGAAPPAPPAATPPASDASTAAQDASGPDPQST